MLSVGAAVVLTFFTLQNEDEQTHQSSVKKGIKRTLFLILIGIVAAAFAVYAGIESMGGFMPISDY
jgi:DMSO reductase anchor subunit